MARLVVDPVTRIEGHLRIEAQLDGGKISDAWSAGTMFRGIELILRERDPREAWIWAQRICGVCTIVHALASVRAVENALDVEVPNNARIVRNLIAGSQMVQDHVIHFYHLHALDWVDVASALKADPAKTSSIAQSISDYEKSSATYFRGIQKRVQGVVDSGQLSLFASDYWGHPAYQLPPEVNLLAVAHYLEALAWQKDFIRLHAVLGGKNPHPQTFLVGGMTTALDPNEPFAVVNPERITFLRKLVHEARRFVEQVYIPDVLAIAPLYKDWFSRGEGVGNFLSYGDYSSGNQKDPSTFLFPRGIVLGRDLSKVYPVDPAKITESINHSWYEYSGGDANGKHPSEGETSPKYTGPKPPYNYLDVEQKYSWLKTPRYDGKPGQEHKNGGLASPPPTSIADARHPLLPVGQTVAVYVWQYPLRLFHWGLVLSIAVLSFTGYYIHNPFIVGQAQRPYLMGWFRFVHEAFGMALIALFLMRLYLFFAGSRWVRWRQYVPLRRQQFKEMLEVMKFYGFLRPTPISKIGHNPMAAFSYIGLYSLVVVEIVTGLVMYNWLWGSPILGALVGWIPRLISLPNLRLIHFFLMFVFIAFGIFHVHLCMLISRAEKRGLMDSIFIGYKVIPAEELEQEEKQAAAEQAR